jgi:YegS/Rv2252/BmrU family lipid kinase
MDHTRTYKIIVNPAAGSGSGARALPRIQQLLAETGLDSDLVCTERTGQGIDLAQEAALAGFDVVVAAGGDGTVNEVINGLMSARQAGGPSPALGVLCVGRGNDFAASVSIPYGLEQGLQALVDDYRRTIDVGRVSGGLFPDGRYFGNCVGVGFDAITTIEVSKLPRLGGFLSFFVAVLKTIFIYHDAPVATITCDGQTLTQRSLLISIMNGRRLGGGFIMAPDSLADDGLFDLCIAQHVSRRRKLGILPHFLRGTQASQPEISTVQARQVSIASVDGPLPAQTDGEIICVDGQRLDVEMLPGHLEIVCRPPEEV